MLDVSVLSALIFILLELFLKKANCIFDPCLEENHKVLHSSGMRGIDCSVQGYGICDAKLGKGWFIVKNYDDRIPRVMHNQEIEMFRCGSQRPIWMNGSHPLVDDGIVERAACSSGPTGYCEDMYPIQVKNCSNYYVYNLTETVGCEGYCFGQSCSGPDPCDSYTELTDGGSRGLSCVGEETKYCDDKLKEGWYKVIYSGKSLDMPTVATKLFSCGTTYPVWLDGTLPTTADIIVNRTGCVVGRTSACDKTYNISIRNCTKFNVYKLGRTTECAERYCFGNTTCTYATKVGDKDDQEICNIECKVSVGVLGGTFLLIAPVVVYKILQWKKWKSVSALPTSKD